MTMRALQAIVLILALALGSTAAACSCARLEDDKAFIDDLFTRADTIVHAKIIGLVTAHEARIEVIESFKGRPSTLKAQPGDEGMCGTKFKVGEEAIFVSYLGQVSSCGRIPLNLELIKNLRAYKR